MCSKAFASRVNLVTTPLWLLLHAFNQSKSVATSDEPSFNQNRLIFKSSQAPRWGPCYEHVRLGRLIIMCFNLYNDITHNSSLKDIKFKKMFLKFLQYVTDDTLYQRHPATIMCTQRQNLQAHLPSTSNCFLSRYAGQLLWPSIHGS